MLGPEDHIREVERDFVYGRRCPVCGALMFPSFGGYLCEECGNFDWRKGIILRRRKGAPILALFTHPTFESKLTQ
jgi:hypothetical protein